MAICRSMVTGVYQISIGQQGIYRRMVFWRAAQSCYTQKLICWQRYKSGMKLATAGKVGTQQTKKPREKSSEMDALKKAMADLVDEILPAKNMQERLERLGSKYYRHEDVAELAIQARNHINILENEIYQLRMIIDQMRGEMHVLRMELQQ